MQNKKNILQRVKAPTPLFFIRLRNIALAMAGIATALLTEPVVLPVAVTTAAGYLLTAATVASAISQLTVKEERGAATKKGGAHGNGLQP